MGNATKEVKKQQVEENSKQYKFIQFLQEIATIFYMLLVKEGLGK